MHRINGSCLENLDVWRARGGSFRCDRSDTKRSFELSIKRDVTLNLPLHFPLEFTDQRMPAALESMIVFIVENPVFNRDCFFLCWSGSIGIALLFAMEDGGQSTQHGMI